MAEFCEKIAISGPPSSGKSALLKSLAHCFGEKSVYIPQDLDPYVKVNKIVTALTKQNRYIFIDEPFAFLSEKEKTELLFLMQSRFDGFLLITHTATHPLMLYGFKELWLNCCSSQHILQ